ncbi:hypothetical protein OQA88_5094 [Cercophora sp. LCS_1]
MGTPPRTKRRRLIDRLTAMLPSSKTLYRWIRWRTALPTGASTSEKTTLSAQQQGQLPSASEPPAPPPLPPVSRNDHPKADPDAPVALMLPGMAELNIGVVNHHDLTTTCPSAPSNATAFVHKPSNQRDLLLTKLPLDTLVSILETPQLSLSDLLALRNTCRTLRRTLPYRTMEQKLSVQNYAGWQVVFEMNGHRYPGTTYGNRRLCGRCVVPKIRGHLIEGAEVREYLLRRHNGNDAADGEAPPSPGGEDAEKIEWPEDRSMCFPCLWTVLAAAPASGGEAGQQTNMEGHLTTVSMAVISKQAGISTKERFRMLDGTIRKILV